MVDTLVNLIVNIEEGWGEHFIYDVMPLKQKRPDLFPMVLAAFANHPRWFIDHLKEIEMILDRYDGEAYIGRSQLVWKRRGDILTKKLFL